MADTIKSGRKVYDLEEGDTIMDNGHCRQLITKRRGANCMHPMISVKEFKAFKSLSCVSEVKDHDWYSGVTLWRYGAATD